MEVQLPTEGNLTLYRLISFGVISFYLKTDQQIVCRGEKIALGISRPALSARFPLKKMMLRRVRGTKHKHMVYVLVEDLPSSERQ